MSAASTIHLSPAERRAQLEQLLAKLLDRANPDSANYQPELAASSQADARIVQRALQRMDDEQLAQAVAPAPPAPVPPTTPEPHPRDVGRFTHGNPGGPGRPRKIHCVEHDSVTIVVNAISPQDLHDITRIAVAQAKEGDGAARRWIYQMAYRHSRTSINDVAALQETGITPDEHRMLLAQKHYGRQMEDIELYRQEVEAELQAQAAAQAQPPAATAPSVPTYAVAAVESRPAHPPTASIPAAAAADPGVLEVRLAPAGGTADRNAEKRPKTVENGREGPARAASNGRAAPQVA